MAAVAVAGEPKLKKNGEPKKKPGPKPKLPAEAEGDEEPPKKKRKAKAVPEPGAEPEEATNGAAAADFVSRAAPLAATVAGVGLKLKPKEFSTGCVSAPFTPLC